MTDYESGAMIYGLLGHNIAYSGSPAMHNHFFATRGMDAVYGLFDISPEDFEPNARSLISAAEGFNITVPYKERIIPLLDELRDAALKTGSVNLVYRKIGYNTDFLALQKLTEPFRNDVKGRECTIFGAGGAARTAAYLFGENGANLRIINRSITRAEDLCAELVKKGISARCEKFSSWPEGSVIHTDCAVNCTSSADVKFPEIVARLAVDFNYGAKARSFREAARGSEKMISGEEILIQQAIYSQKIWNNTEPSYEEFAEVLNVQ